MSDRCIAALLAVLSALAGSISYADDAPKTPNVAVSRESVSFTAATAYQGGVTVRGELCIPETGRERAPAVLILHGSGGIQSAGAFYAEALNQAGIATLEIEMFSRGNRPRTTRVTMPHGYGSLLFLAGHPRIDPNNIGVLGYSYGGLMALLMTSKAVTQQYTAGKASFKAHVPLYPVCYIQVPILEGVNKFYGPETYLQLTGAPVSILTGEKDGYDDPDTCTKLVAGFPEQSRRLLSVTVYPGAYHSFDVRESNTTFQDPLANKGRGGYVTVKWNAEVASTSRRSVVEFFQTHLQSK